MIKIQSFSDIITNSSSEVFLVKTTTSKKDFEEELRKLEDDGCSGMGGSLLVADNQTTISEEYGGEFLLDNKDPDDLSYPDMPDGFLIIDTDWNKDVLIKYINEKYSTVNLYDYNSMEEAVAALNNKSNDKDSKLQ
jgi:hypothetical protein